MKQGTTKIVYIIMGCLALIILILYIGNQQLTKRILQDSTEISIPAPLNRNTVDHTSIPDRTADTANNSITERTANTAVSSITDKSADTDNNIIPDRTADTVANQNPEDVKQDTAYDTSKPLLR